MAKGLKSAWGAVLFAAAAACGVPVPCINYEKQSTLVSEDGYKPSSPRVQEALVSGEKLVMETDLTKGSCYAFLVTRDNGKGNLLFTLRKCKKKIDEAFVESKNFAVLHHCPSEDATYKLEASLSGADSGVVVGVWKKEGPVGAPGGKGSCDDPFRLTAGQEVAGSTKGLGHSLQGACIQGKASEAVYRIDIAEASSFTAELDADFDAGLYLLDQCSGETEALACSDDYGMKSGKSRINVTLEPGAYFLVVDGFGTMSGEYSLRSSVTALVPPDELCGQAPQLAGGPEIKGSTADMPDTFHGTCAHGSKGPDRLYGIKIEVPSRARFGLETLDYDGVLHLHAGCPGQSAEIACNDDFGDNKHAMIMADLEPGNYTLVVDGFDGTDAGAYTLSMETFSDSDAPSEDDQCGKAPALDDPAKADEGTVTVTGSTFRALDDVQPSCSPSPGGPDVFRSFHLDAPSAVSVRAVSSDFPGIVLSISKGCGGKSLACQVEKLETLLPAGDYILAVDSLGADQLGDFELEMRLQSVEELNKICAAGKPLADGKLLKGTTGGTGSFKASCGCMGQGPENVHVLKIKKKSSIRIEVNPQGFDSVIYIRRNCEEKSSEVACNDDAGSTSQSVIEASLEKGTYYVFVDGCREGESGDYTIRAIVK